ncbi:uncharacterized protein BP01DRAFT_200343 [Aspergillus saccharolyticus JOP 1030-1]|uniref:Uncharacterized protein n=1 Tax=Aspergillus saccharolyticus JOP 1030-1 TaxID=1450539 RepID=A0A318ZUB2_9EURO|nr:hypothetical protein BP01DRAFT_200343 [Aspergillus saccharolyticus JOP 1030-1]PYH47913.1 hypothetical protein BP01DRAFT_200343 [Aspergillus saccharolyticus JOP 1030-1]
MQALLTTPVFFFLFIATTMAENLTRYHTAPPSNAIIIYDRQTLNDLARANADGLLWDENGGYYLKTAGNEIIAVAADALCTELDAAHASAAATWAERNLNGNDKEVAAAAPASQKDADVTKSGANLACYPHCARGKCSHPRCFTNALCTTYNYCHICSGSYKYCI